jgi:hypothetical protein
MRTVRANALVGSFAAVVVMAAGCGREPSSGSGGGVTQGEAVTSGPTCSGTGAHDKHGFTSCTTCHVCGGIVQFDPNGPAVAPGKLPPSFDTSSKTCSSVACHGVPAGTYSYYFPGGDGTPELKTVTYGGTAASTTPSWYATGIGCTACHGNPPANYVWHSGSHGGGNQCELCHIDAVSQNGIATGLNPATNCGPNGTTPCAALHANGVLDVTAQFNSTCFGCH